MTLDRKAIRGRLAQWRAEALNPVHQADQEALLSEVERLQDTLRLLVSPDKCAPTCDGCGIDRAEGIRRAHELLGDAPEPQPERKRYEWRYGCHDNKACATLWLDDEETDAGICQCDGELEYIANLSDKWYACNSIPDGQARILAALGINPADVKEGP